MSRPCQQPAPAFSRQHRLGWTAALVLALLAVMKPAQLLAAPDDVVRAGEDEAPRAQVNVVAVDFDQMAFSGFANRAAARRQIATRMGLYLKEVNAACELSDEQMAKLELAIAGDIKRRFDAVVAFRDRYRAANGDQDAILALWQEIQGHTSKIDQVFFGECSMVGKTMCGVLTAEQLSRYSVMRDERKRSYYMATVEAYLVAVEEVVPMTAAQHEALVDLLIHETAVPLIRSEHGLAYVRYQLATFSDEQLARILDDRQRLLLEQQLFHAFELKSFLIKQGLLPAENPPPDADSEAPLSDTQK